MKKELKIGVIPLAALILGTTALTATACTKPSTMKDADYVPSMAFTLDDLKGTTIEFWTGFGQTIDKTLVPMLEDFQEMTGINVTYESKGGYPNLQSAINLGSANEKYPNIANGYGDHFASYVESDIIMHLDGYIEADADRSTVDEIEHIDYDQYYEGYKRENESIEYDDEGNGYVLGVPFNKSTEVGTYNKTFFDVMLKFDATIKTPDQRWTWNDVETEGAKVNKVLEDNDLYGHVYAKKVVDPTNPDSEVIYGVYADETAVKQDGAETILDLTATTKENFHLLSYNSTDNWFITGVRQWGGTYTAIDPITRRGYVTFDSQQTRNLLTRLKDLFDKGYLGIPATWEESLYCSNPFKAVKSAINISSSAGVSNSIPDPATKFEVDVCTVPYLTEENAYVISQGTNLALFNKGTDKQRFASWLLLIYLTQQANDEFCMGTGYYPTGSRAANTDEYKAYISSDIGLATERLEKKSARLNTEVYDNPDTPYQKFVDPAFKGSSFIRDTVGTIISTLFYEDKTIDEILADVLRTLSQYVRS